jgi:hypothetical protein
MQRRATTVERTAEHTSRDQAAASQADCFKTLTLDAVIEPTTLLPAALERKGSANRRNANDLTGDTREYWLPPARQRDLIGSPRNDRSQCNNPLDTTPTPSMAKPSYQSVALGGLAEHPPAHSAKPCTATTKPTAADATSHAMPTKIVGPLLLACANEHSQVKRKYTLYPAAIVIRKLTAYRSGGVYLNPNKDSKRAAIASRQTTALIRATTFFRCLFAMYREPTWKDVHPPVSRRSRSTHVGGNERLMSKSTGQSKIVSSAAGLPQLLPEASPV